MHGSPAERRHIVGIASVAVIEVKARRGFGMDQSPVEETNAHILFSLQRVAQHVGETADAQRADGIDKQGLAAVEGANVSEAILQASPTRCLHRSADLQGKLVEVHLPLIRGNAALQYKAAQVAVGGVVVK